MKLIFCHNPGTKAVSRPGTGMVEFVDHEAVVTDEVAAILAREEHFEVFDLDHPLEDEADNE